MRLSEREGAVARTDQLLAEWRAGRGSVIVVSGPVGSGKTALLGLVSERAARRGGRFFSVTASASERQHQLGLVHQLVKAMRTAGMADPGLDLAPGGAGEPWRSSQQLQAFARAVCDVAGAQPLIIAIDDVHFADDASLRYLTYLIRRIEWSPVMVVLSESSCHEPELSRLHAETLHLPFCHRLLLTPLTPEGIAEVVAARLGAAPTPRVTECFADASGGSPVLLHALVEDYLVRDIVPDEPDPGAWFRIAIVRCLHRGTAEMLAVARAVAVLGAAATPLLIGDIIGADATAVDRALRELRAAGLLGDRGYRHTAGLLATLADIPAKDLPEMHSRAAELLHGSGAPATAVAGQLLAAHDQVKAAWRVSILREAAREAMAAGDVLDAVAYLRHAVGLCADAAQAAAVTALLADAQWHLDPAKANRYLPGLIQDVQSRLLTGPEALVPVRHLIWQGDLTQAAALLRALDSAPPADPATTGEPSTDGWWLAFYRHGLLAPSEKDTGRSVLWGRMHPFVTDVRTDDIPGGSIAAGLSVLLMTLSPDHPPDALREPLPDSVARVPMRRAAADVVRAAAALRGGDPVGASTAAHAALDSVGHAAWGVAIGVPMATLIRAALAMGDLDGAAFYLSRPVPAAMFETPFALPYLQTAAAYHLAVGDPQTALSGFRLCGEVAARWQLDVSELVDWRTGAVAALLALGREDEARDLIRQQLSLLGDRPSQAREIARHRLATIGDGTDRLLVREPASALPVDLPPDDPPPPEPPAVPVPAPRPVPPAEGDDGGVAGLTDAERRVAALAAAGATNRQIANRLFITVSTVEQHLTKIYRKLNVRRRSGLPAELLRHMH